MFHSRFVAIAYAPLLLLFIPLITNAPWTLSDYIIGGVLLAMAGSLYLTIMKIATKPYRMILVALLLLVFVLTWAELAVGLFGTPFAGS